jgi:hypothetical protein
MKNLSHKILKYIFLSTFISLLLIIIWGINKGFDITDEGFYILGYQSDQESGITIVTNFQRIIKHFFGVISLDIINVRILRLVLQILSTAIFSYALKVWIDKKVDFIYVFSLLGIGSLLSFGFGPQSLSYNSLLSICIISAFSFLLLGIKAEKFNTRLFYLLITGILLSLSTFIKPPAGVIVSIALLIFYFSIGPSGYRTKFANTGYVLLGVSLMTIYYFSFIQSFDSFYKSFTITLDVLNQNSKTVNLKDSHSNQALIKRIIDLIFLIYNILCFVCIYLIGFFLIKKLIKKKLIYLFVNILLAIVFIIHFNSEYLVINYERNATPYMTITLFIIIYPIIELIRNKEPIHNKSLISSIAILFFLPFLGAFGTNNALISNSMYMLVCWMGILVLVYYGINSSKIFSFFILGLLSISSLYLFINHYVLSPYRIDSLLNQNTKISSERVLVDAPTKAYLTKIHSILKNNNFKAGDLIIGIYKMPGIIYLNKGRSPGSSIHPWNEAQNDLFYINLKNSKTKYKEAFIFIKNKYNQSFIDSINSFGLNFPKDYHHVGSVQIPGRFKAVTGRCHIYAHKNKVKANVTLAYEISQQAFRLLNSGENKKSISLYLKSLSIIPNNTTALNNLGLAYMRLSEFNNAAIVFKKAIDLEPSFNLAINNLNWAVAELEKSKQ